MKHWTYLSSKSMRALGHWQSGLCKQPTPPVPPSFVRRYDFDYDLDIISLSPTTTFLFNQGLRFEIKQKYKKATFKIHVDNPQYLATKGGISTPESGFYFAINNRVQLDWTITDYVFNFDFNDQNKLLNTTLLYTNEHGGTLPVPEYVGQTDAVEVHNMDGSYDFIITYERKDEFTISGYQLIDRIFANVTRGERLTGYIEVTLDA